MTCTVRIASLPVEQRVGQRPAPVAGDAGRERHALADEVLDHDLRARTVADDPPPPTMRLPLRFRCNRLPLGGGRVARWGVLSTHRIRPRHRIARRPRPRARLGAGGWQWRHLDGDAREPSSGPLPLADSPLGRTIATTATDIWNDSCAVDELEYAISYGAVGATANPTIVTDVWKKRSGLLARSGPGARRRAADATEVDLAWAIVEEMSLRAAPLLLPAVRGLRRPPGPPLDADRPDLLPRL